MSELVSVPNNDVDARFSSLISQVLGQYDSRRGLGYMTTSIYDTAWVACIQNPDGEWLFPEAFQQVLLSQDEQGAWSASSDVSSRILDSLAGLYALVKHKTKTDSAKLANRIATAQEQLGLWLGEFEDVERGGVGFEVIVPLCSTC